MLKQLNRQFPTTTFHRSGIQKTKNIYHNLNYTALLQHELKNNEGQLLKTKYGNTFSIDTGKFTGRSPKDKWIVKNLNSESDKNIWWGDVNKPMTSGVFDDLYKKVINHFNTLDKYYVFDGYCGSSKTSQKKVRFIHELAWQQHFVKNMFITKDKTENIELFNPDFTIINACSIQNDDWEKQNLNSEVAIAFNIEKKIGIIMGTWYGGENKKGIFSLMNYWLPLQKIMSMHCSANVGKNGDSALFFGLSGTGKTTLSADSKRYLIGDDEHGWDDNGIFNLEGGCYAKTIGLQEKNEPEIFKAIKENALLENVSYNHNNEPEYDNSTKTENGRVSYPINHIKNWHEPQIADHPKNIIFLTCDAYGVLPPVSKLNNEQAMYYFLSGYTSKVAGTERGITEPQATFSSCFGSAFLTLHPIKYAQLFETKINTHQTNIFLVNTGWIGGPYGIGKRINISDTRKCIDAILSGEILNSKFNKESIFNLEIPIHIDGMDQNILIPENSWDDKKNYHKYATKLSNMFKDNYKQYKQPNIKDYSTFGPI
jgi:phosphoenolpyruvate carboxykinase (ATP)